MGRFIPDLLRAVADGWDQAAGRDPVDRHAETARAALFDGDRYTVRVAMNPDGPWTELPANGESQWVSGSAWARVMTAEEVASSEPDGAPPKPPNPTITTDGRTVTVTPPSMDDFQCGCASCRRAEEAKGLEFIGIAQVSDDDPDEVVVSAASDVVVDAALHLAEARSDAVSAREQLDMVVANVQRLADFLDKQATAHVKEMTGCDSSEDAKEANLAGLATAYRNYASELRSFVGRTTEWTGRPLDAKLAEKNSDPADTAKVGEELGADWVAAQGDTCSMKGPNLYGCTRAIGHDGQHVATASGWVVEVWPNEPALPADVQGVIDAARAHADIFHDDLYKIIGLPTIMAIVRAVRALDGDPIPDDAEVAS